jgi:hypothetical protein
LYKKKKVGVLLLRGRRAFFVEKSFFFEMFFIEIGFLLSKSLENSKKSRTFANKKAKLRI